MVVELWWNDAGLAGDLLKEKGNENKPFKSLVKFDGHTRCFAPNNFTPDTFDNQATVIADKDDIQIACPAQGQQGCVHLTKKSCYADIAQGSLEIYVNLIDMAGKVRYKQHPERLSAIFLLEHFSITSYPLDLPATIGPHSLVDTTPFSKSAMT